MTNTVGSLQLVFMGTPAFAVPVLESLLASEHQVSLVVTQPDRPKGRGRRLTPPPVKSFALTNQIAVVQPERLKDPLFHERLRKEAPDVIVVVAYGKILPPDILLLPQYGCVNVHASLLPKYRGAAPIQWALLKGEQETGVTTMMMDEGMDTGDVLLQRSVAVGAEENFGTLYDRLSRIGAELLLETLSALVGNRLMRQPQTETCMSLAPPLKSADESISWYRAAEEIKNQVRALDPCPGARTFFGERVLKVWRVKILAGQFSGVPGQVLQSGQEGIVVRAGEGAVMIEELQVAGGRRLPAAVFIRGNVVPEGYIFT